MDPILLAVIWAAFFVGAGILTCFIMRLRLRKSWQNISVAFTFFVGMALLAIHIPAVKDSQVPWQMWSLAFLDVLRCFTLDYSFQLLEGVQSGWLGLYYTVEIILSVLAAFCSAAILLSLLRRFGRIWRFLVPCRPVYYFSELNEKSFVLAKNIMEAWENTQGSILNKPVLNFCKSALHDDAEELRFHSEARKLGAVFYQDPIYAIPKSNPRRRTVKVFLMDTDENANISAALKMKPWITGCPQPLIRFGKVDSDLLVFSTEDSAEVLFDKLLKDVDQTRLSDLIKQGMSKEKAQALYAGLDAYIDLHLINETKFIAQKLLWEHPLFDAAENGKVSVLLVGGGRLGMEILRTALVCGVMDHCGFEAVVVDAQADLLEKQFDHEYPALPARLKDTVRFYQADVTTSDFDMVLQTHCTGCRYIVVATGDDERNLITARFLRQWYARQDIEAGRLSFDEQIYVAIRGSERHETLSVLGGDNMILFGCNTRMFSPEELLDRLLDRMAMLYNLCYDGGLMLGKLFPPEAQAQEVIREAKRKYYRLETVYQRSNQLVALHGLYKLWDLQCFGADPGQDIQEQFGSLLHCLTEHDRVMYELEHDRWEVYQALSGWKTFPKDKIRNGLEKKDSYQKGHKHLLAKLHGCMIPYDDLDGLAALLKRNDFRLYDQAMCVASLLVWIKEVAKPSPETVVRVQSIPVAPETGVNGDVLLSLLCEEFPK